MTKWSALHRKELFLMSYTWKFRIINQSLKDSHIVSCIQIYAWGQNNCGQVGSGTTTNQPTPRKVIAVIGQSYV